MELILQNFAFDKSANKLVVKMLEALYFCLLLNTAAQLSSWAETIVEAYFLQTSLFSAQKADDDYSYEHDLLNRIQQLVSKEQESLEDIAQLSGMIDSLTDQQQVLKAKIKAQR